MRIALAVCPDAVRAYLEGAKGKFQTPQVDFIVNSGAQSHLIHFIDAEKQPGWVEIQTLTLLEIDGDSAVGKWTRSVNNRDRGPADGNRVFFEHGDGKFKRISTECDRSMVNAT